MGETSSAIPAPDPAELEGCAYVLGEATIHAGATQRCGRPRRAGSSYCPEHHARCHLPAGSAAERRRLHRFETLALAVGGRCGRDARAPSLGSLSRIGRLSRIFL
jgi:hypothetical protein